MQVLADTYAKFGCMANGCAHAMRWYGWYECVDIPVISSTYPCDIDMVTNLNAGFAPLPARRRILLAEPVRLPPSNGACPLEDNQSSANALESTRTTILKNYRRDARFFCPLVRRTKPLTLPDAAPYSDADEEEAF